MWRAVHIGLALLAAQFACEKPEEPAPREALVIHDTRLIGDPAPPDPPDIEVSLLDAGAEPRRALRYRVDPSRTQEVVVTFKMTQQIDIDGNRMTAPSLPPSRAHLRLRASETTPPDEQLLLHVEIVEFEVIDWDSLLYASGDQLKRTLDELRGYRFDLPVASTGLVDPEQITNTRPDLGGDATMYAGQLWSGVMNALATPLPDEPVGLGARWRVGSPIVESGMPMTNEMTFELVAMDGDVLKLRHTVIVKSGNNTIGSQQFQMEWLNMDSEGEGERTVDLGQLAPLEERSAASFSISMRVRSGKESQQIDVTGAMESRVEKP